MNKKELAAAVAEKCGMTQGDAAAAVDATLDAITGSMKAGSEVRLLGFGSFVVADRPAGKGRNPKTGEEIDIKAARLPKFKPGKGLKDALND